MAEKRYFAVTAYNDWGESGFSEEISADIPDGSGCTLQWNIVPSATGYRVYWGIEPGVYIPVAGIDSDNTTSHIFVRPPAPGNVTIIQ